MRANRFTCKNIYLSCVRCKTFFRQTCVRHWHLVVSRVKWATLSSSYGTFKLDYVFSTKWFEGDRSGWLLLWRARILRSLWRLCGIQVSWKHIKEDGLFLSARTQICARRWLQIGASTREKMLRASRYTFESWSATRHRVLCHVL